MARSVYAELLCKTTASDTVLYHPIPDTSIQQSPKKQIDPSTSNCADKSFQIEQENQTAKLISSSQRSFTPTLCITYNIDTNVSTPRCIDTNELSKESTEQISKGELKSEDHFQHDISIATIECKHWLEVEDKYHRYGTYLRPYYDVWASLGSPGNFFHWLDFGDGRYIYLSQSYQPKKKFVSRSVLDRCRVHYCTQQERKRFRVEMRDGLLVWVSENAPDDARQYDCVDTGTVSERWIFVIDDAGHFYVNRKLKGRFHHSSFVAGGPVRAAGRIVVMNGEIICIGPNSGHYRTPKEQLEKALRIFFALPADNESLSSVLLDAESMDQYYTR